MARVPPSTDFSPAWLKFSANKKSDKPLLSSTLLPTSGAQTKSGGGKVTSNLTGSPIRASLAANFTLEKPHCEPKSLARHHSVDNDKSWPLSIGVDGTDERQQWPSSSKHSRNKWSLSTINNDKSMRHGEHVLNGLVTKGKTDALDVEFPSLGNDASDSQHLQQSSLTYQPNNMWSKPLVLKPQNDETQGGLTTDTSKAVQHATSIYKSLFPKSSSGLVKPYRRTISVPVGMPHNDLKSAGSNFTNSKKATIPVSSSVSKGRESPKTPNSEDANVTPAVKRHRKGKNVFLKELRQDDGLVMDTSRNTENVETQLSPDHIFTAAQRDSCDGLPDSLDSEATVINNIEDDLESVDDKEDEKDWWDDVTTNAAENKDEKISNENTDEINPPLSSSLEAEHRLLREMGWTQGNKDAYGDAGADESPLTDAEIREFFMQNKKKGLLAVPSISHRANALRDALSAWSSSGPVLRRNIQQEKIDEETSKINFSPDCSSSEISQFSDSDPDFN